MNVEDLIARMTLEQKCALLSGATEFTTRGFPALGIPELRFSDGPSGLRKQAGASDHLGLNPSPCAPGPAETERMRKTAPLEGRFSVVAPSRREAREEGATARARAGGRRSP